MRYITNMKYSGFDKIKRGNKTHGYRLYDAVGEALKIDDEILIRLEPDLKECILVKVTGIAHYKTFYDMYTDFFDVDFKYRYRSVNDILKETFRHWYTEEEEREQGAMVFKFQVIKTFSKL